MSIEDKKQMFKALLWIIPINFSVLILGFTYTAHRIQQLEENQINMQSGDSIRGVKIDSANDALKAVHNLEDTLNKIK